jgi:hypothetical protein
LSVKAFAEAEDAEKGLAAALKATGQEVDGNLSKMKALADAIQLTTTVEGDSLLPIMKSGIAMGLNTDQAIEAAKAAVGLSKAYGIELKDAMSGVAKEMLGIESSLTRSIPQLKGVEGATDRLAIISKQAAVGMEEQFDAATSTMGGFAQLKNTVGDLMESLGELIAGPLNSLVQWFHNLIQATTSYAQSSADSFDSVSSSVGAMGSFLGSVFSTIGSWIENLVFFFSNLGIYGKLLGVNCMIGFGTMLDAATWAFRNIVSIGKWVWDNLGTLFQDGVNFAITIFGNLWENIKRIFTGIWDWISSGGKKGFENGFVGLAEGFKAKTTSLPEYKAYEESMLTKVAKEDKQHYLKELQKKKEAWAEAFEELPKQKEKAKKELSDIDLQLTDEGQRREAEKQKEKEKQSNAGRFTSPSEVWKQMQTAVLKQEETKAEQIAKAELIESKKQTKLLETMAKKKELTLTED